MNLLRAWLGRLKSDPSVEYTHIALPAPNAQPIQPDKQYLRVWLRSARITEVRRWTTKFHASVHAHFEIVDRAQPRREVVCVVAPDKTFAELDPRNTDRLITVNKALLGPIPWRGELECDIGLFSIAATDLAKPYLSLLADLTEKAGVASLTQALPWVDPIRRGAEILFSEAQRSNLETGLSRTDTTLAAGHWLVARVPKGQLPAGLQLDPNDYGLLDARGRPVAGFPYMVVGLEVLDQRDDYATLPDVKPAWDAVTKAAAEGTDDDVRQRFAQLRRTVGLSPDLVPADRRRVIELFREELVGAGFAIEPTVAPTRSLEASAAPLASGKTADSPRTLRRAEDLLTPRAMVDGSTTAAPQTRARGRTAAEMPSAAPLAVTPTVDVRMPISELQEMMLDPELPDRELRRYFIIDRERSRPFAPELAFDATKVAVQPPAAGLEGAMFVGVANRMARWRRQMRFEHRMARGDARPVLVSEGDSWFQFPIFLEDVVDQLGAEFNIWSVDAAGDTLRNMVSASGEYLQALRRQRGRVRAFLFSGSGNDILGNDDEGRSQLLTIIRRFEAGRSPEWYLAGGEFDQRLREIDTGYRALFESVATEFPGLPVICHGYDHAIPGGWPGDPRNPPWAAQDAWLGAPLRELGISDPALQWDIVRLMINRLNQRLRTLCGGNNEGGAYAHAWNVDARGAVQHRHWADELHPQDEGYAAVAQRFSAVIRQAIGLPQADLEFDPSRAPRAACDAVDEIEPLRAPRRGETGALESLAQPAKKGRRRAAKAAALEAATPAGWRLAASLRALRDTVNAMAPSRSKLSDGSIGDAVHATRDSDHNPWVVHEGKGIVTAIDVTHDPQGGCDAGRLAEALRLGRDPRVKYVIFDRRIFSSTIQPWQWRPYGGANPHSHHIHVSVAPSVERFDDTTLWQVSV